MKAIQLIWGVFLLFVTASAGAAAPPSKPTVMALMIGVHDGASYEMTYDGRELRYYEANNIWGLKAAKPVVIQPSAEQRETFLSVPLFRSGASLTGSSCSLS